MPWLDSRHTFSFGEYHDPDHLGYRALRVINDDRIAEGQGFGRHPHRDMEIITYVLSGQLEHQDSMGNGEIINAGDVQYMSAGSGVYHSEFNPSESEPVHLLQIWIIPNARGLEPKYEQRRFSGDGAADGWRLLISESGEHNSIVIRQDARMYGATLEKDQELVFTPANDRHVWVHVATGSVKLNGQTLEEGDAAAVHEEPLLTFRGNEESKVLLFDLA